MPEISRFLGMIWVTDARYLDGYRLWVRFSDGVEGTVDLTDLIARDPRLIVQALRDLHTFSALRAEMDTVVWSNGFDLAPEYLYERVRAQAPA